MWEVLVSNIVETLGYFEQVFDKGIGFTDTVNVQATEGISVDVKITFKLPKIIIRDGRCYNVEEKILSSYVILLLIFVKTMEYIMN